MLKKEILIIDSNEDRAEIYYSEIRHLFDDFHIAGTHAEARDLVELHEFTSIIISPFVSDGTIRDFLKELRHNDRTRVVPIIVISNLPSKSEKIDYYSYGADEYFELPIDRELFKETVRRELLQFQRIIGNTEENKKSGVLSQSQFLEEVARRRIYLKSSQENASLVLIAPVAIDFISKQYGPETADRLFDILIALLKENCQEDFVASRWTRKSLIVMVMKKDKETIKATMDGARQVFLDQTGFIPRLKETPGLRSVITDFMPDADVQDQLQSLSSQLGYISMYNKAPIQIMEKLEAVKKEIVIADPDKVSVNIMNHRLSQEGFKVTVTDDPVKIKTISQDGDLAAILIDTMVEDGGVALIKQLKSQPETEEIPVLVLSRYGHDEDVVEAFKVGANDYMLKPLSLTEMTARIKRLSNR